MLKKILSGFCLVVTAFSVQAAPIQWAANGNYYEFIDGTYTRASAEAAASASTYLGAQGYLATITSAGEQSFLFDNWNSAEADFWIGGSDASTEGQWAWVTGPEAGTVFYDAGTTLTYSAWVGGEPNDFVAGEDFLVFGWNSAGQWNDIGQPQFPNWTAGYIVEYGSASVPGPASSTILLFGLLLLGMSRRRRLE